MKKLLRSISLVITFIIVITMLSSCGSNKKYIIGEWESNDGEVIEFLDDGICEISDFILTLLSHNGIVENAKDITYSVHGKDRIKLFYSTDKSSSELTLNFKIEDDILTIGNLTFEKVSSITAEKGTSKDKSEMKLQDVVNEVGSQEFSDGVVWVYRNSEWILFDTKGKQQFKINNKDISGEKNNTAPSNFYNGVAVVGNRLIDKKNNTIFECEPSTDTKEQYLSTHGEFIGYAFVHTKTNTFDLVENTVGIIDHTGNWVVQPTTDLNFIEDRAYGQIYKGIALADNGGHYNYYNYYNLETNEIVFGYDWDMCKLEEMWRFNYRLKHSEGIALGGFYVDNKFGENFYDSNGNVKIDLSQYQFLNQFCYSYSDEEDSIPYFSNGYCILDSANATGDVYTIVIDQQGNRMFDPIKIGNEKEIDKSLQYIHGHISQDLFWMKDENSSYSYLDIHGNSVIKDINAVKVSDFTNDKIARIETKEEVYYIDTTGKRIL